MFVWLAVLERSDDEVEDALVFRLLGVIGGDGGYQGMNDGAVGTTRGTRDCTDDVVDTLIGALGLRQ